MGYCIWCSRASHIQNAAYRQKWHTQAHLNVECGTHLCKSHTRLHNRLHPCRTRRIIPVRTSPRASPTLCGSSAPLCRLHRPGNSRSHPGRSVCSAASRHTAPRCICRGSSPRTWHWRPTPQHLALWVKTRLWWGGETSLGAGRVGELVERLLSLWMSALRERRRSGAPLGDLSGVTYGSSGCMVISSEQLCFAHDLPSSISSFRCCRPFCQSAPFLEIRLGSGIYSGPPSRNWNSCDLMS